MFESVSNNLKDSSVHFYLSFRSVPLSLSFATRFKWSAVLFLAHYISLSPFPSPFIHLGTVTRYECLTPSSYLKYPSIRTPFQIQISTIQTFRSSVDPSFSDYFYFSRIMKVMNSLFCAFIVLIINCIKHVFLKRIGKELPSEWVPLKGMIELIDSSSSWRKVQVSGHLQRFPLKLAHTFHLNPIVKLITTLTCPFCQPSPSFLLQFDSQGNFYLSFYERGSLPCI